VWFLTRQWQLGELQGEDASSPVIVNLRPEHRPLTYDRSRPELDPTVIPAEAIVEAEPGGWWTLGRRLRIGREVATLLDPAIRSTFAFGPLPEPYDRLADDIDGLAVFRNGVLAGHPIWAEVPSPAPDRWSSSTLTYDASFEATGTALRVNRHPGGDLDWFSVDADLAAQPVTRAPDGPAPIRFVIPGRLVYPGAPKPRWWQLEDRAVDLGGFAPDRSHLGTMLLFDVAVAHADDWFSVPIPPPPDPSVEPSIGVLVSLTDVTVRDSFDQIWPLEPPPITGLGGWSLFHTTGLLASQLLLWPVAVAPASGNLLDDILIGVDEDANLAWAVEMRADGRPLLTDATTADAERETTRTGSRDFRYLPSTTLPQHWHPYQRIRADDPSADGGPPSALVGAGDGRSGSWRQAVLADLTGEIPIPRPGPISRLIGGPSGPGLGRGHELASDAIPSSGVRIRRRAMLARDSQGRPVLWVERTAGPAVAPPTSHLRFDVLAEDATDHVE
jgi:hypothetical protein